MNDYAASSVGPVSLFVAGVIVFLLHAGLLQWVGRSRTEAARRVGFWISAMPIVCVLALGILVSRFDNILQGEDVALLFGIMACGLWIWTAGIRAYSLPSGVLSLLPLALYYALLIQAMGGICSAKDGVTGYLGFFTIPRLTGPGDWIMFQRPDFARFVPFFVAAALPLSAYLFPRHRRMLQLWRPARLPRLREGRPE